MLYCIYTIIYFTTIIIATATTVTSTTITTSLLPPSTSNPTPTDHMHATNPKTENLRPLRPFLDMPPVRVLGLLIDVKAEVNIHFLHAVLYINIVFCSTHIYIYYI